MHIGDKNLRLTVSIQVREGTRQRCLDRPHLAEPLQVSFAVDHKHRSGGIVNARPFGYVAVRTPCEHDSRAARVRPPEDRERWFGTWPDHALPDDPMRRFQLEAEDTARLR